MHLLRPQLDEKAKLLAKKLFAAPSSSKVSGIIDHLIKLQELFSKQYKLQQRIGYCDNELAYVIYQVITIYFDLTKLKIQAKSEAIYSELVKTIRARDYEFQQIAKGLVDDTADPLQTRLNSLMGKSSSPSLNENENVNGGKHTNHKSFYKILVLPAELKELMDKNSVLIIDYRPVKNYENNHIKYQHLVNIDPEIVMNLPNDAHDTDLEDQLRPRIPYLQFQHFQERHKYQQVVIYDYKYGAMGQDRFQDIYNEIETENSAMYPFDKLVNILFFQNKYISSSLKLMPSYLTGGVYNWYQQFGEELLERLRDVNAISNGSEVVNGKKYTLSFNDYLSTSNKDSDPPRQEDHPNLHPVFAPFVTKPALPKKEPLIASSTIGMQPYTPSLQNGHKNGQSNGNMKISTDSAKKSGHMQLAQAKTNNQSSISKPNLLEEFSTGLVNLGNSCYLNSVVQCLTAAPDLTSFFVPSITYNDTDSYKQHINVNNKLGTQGKLTMGFVELILNMLKNDGKLFSPSKFKQIAGALSPGGQFATYDQQDCVEFLDFLLDGLHEDLNQFAVSDPKEKQRIMELTPEQEHAREVLPVRLASTIEWERYLKLNFSIIVDKFQGQYLSQLKCLECKFTSTSYNAFSILSLPIPEKLGRGSNQTVTLNDCLEEFITTELLDEDNKWHCPRCKKLTKSTKRIAITRLPQILILNFKRFKLHESNQLFRKLETFVTYPVTEVLDLTKYWSDIGTTLSDESLENRMTPEEEQQRLKNLPVRNQVPPFKYKLFAVANHFGNLTTGHYTAYVYKKDRKSVKNWCYFEDSRVTKNVSPSQVMNKNAYCLFFRRV